MDINQNIVLNLKSVIPNLFRNLSNAGKMLKQFQHDRRGLLILISFILLCVSALIINKFAVSPESLIWYSYLLKPALNPPDWIFQGVWVFLYLLMSLSLYLVLNSENTNQEVFLNKLKNIGINFEPHIDAQKKNNKKHALILFGIQIFLSILLIPAFFGLKSTTGGLLISIFLLMSIVLMLYKFYKITIPAALLTIPAVLWSAYLVGLNLTFWMLNNTQWVLWSFKHNLL